MLTERPRFIPFQALVSIRVLLISPCGLTVKVLHPNGMMPRILGLIPVSISYDVIEDDPGGPVVRLRQSTACSTR